VHKTTQRSRRRDRPALVLRHEHHHQAIIAPSRRAYEMQDATPKRMRAALFWAIVAVGGCAASNVLGAQEPSKATAAAPGANPSPAGKGSSALAPASTSVQKSALPFDEEIPPGGVDNLMFSDAAIRYCLAQIIRIDAVRPLVDRYERPQVEYFNTLVADYNNRCGHYRYVEGARESAQAQVEPSRSKIESDARDAYRKRFALAEKEAPAKKSAAVSAPAAKSAQSTRSASATASPSPPQAARAATTARPEIKQETPLPATAPPSARPASTPPPETNRQSELAAAAPISQPRPSEVASAATAPPSARPASTPPPDTNRQSELAAAAPISQPRPSEVATGTAEPERKAQAPNKTTAAILATAQPDHAEVRAAPQETKQQSAPAAPPAPVSQSLARANTPPDAKSQATVLAAATPSSQGERPALSAAPLQSKPPSSASPELQSQAPQSAPVATAPQANVKETPQPPPSSAPPAVQSESRPAAAPSPPAPPASPPVLAKLDRDNTRSKAVERFAAEVQRVASQVLDERDYPKEARGKDWRGTTQIEVRYDAGGYIRSIVVGESSGHPSLDDTALQIARNIRLPSAPEELRSRDFAIRFPIVFQPHNP